MTDEQEPTESSQEESLKSQDPKVKAKKIAKKAAKKATKKAAKRTVKKVSKKAAKKVGKKAAKKAPKNVVEEEVVGADDPERPLGGDSVKEIEPVEKATKELVTSKEKSRGPIKRRFQSSAITS